MHLTDVHLTPDPIHSERFREALDQIYAMDDRPDLLIQGGDAIMDALHTGREASEAQFAAWRAVWADYREIPLRNCIGNHDVWGWNAGNDDSQDDVSRRGHLWPVREFGMEGRYESFEMGGWKFITLDSTRPSGSDYYASCDDEQFQWLSEQIESTPADQPILLTSHIPIISACGFFEPGQLKDGDWVMPGSWMHRDAMELKNLFWRSPNVKLCLSGHMHQVDYIEFNGVGYYCSGAVSGAWWAGRYYECDPGYAVIDLFEDGTYAIDYVLTPEGRRSFEQKGRG